MSKKKNKKVKAHELKDVKVSFVSYVTAPANGQPFSVLKSVDGAAILNKSTKQEPAKAADEKPQGTFKKAVNNFLTYMGLKKDTESGMSDEDSEFIQEVGGMSKAEEFLKKLDDLSKKVDDIGKNKTDEVNPMVAKIATMKKETENLTGDDKTNMEKSILVAEKLVKAQEMLDNAETQLETFKKQLETEKDETRISALKSATGDKEILISMLKDQIESVQPEVEKLLAEKTEPAANTEPGTTEPKKTEKKEDDKLDLILKTMGGIEKRLDTLEGHREVPKSKDGFEVSDDVLLGKSGPEDPEHPENAFKNFSFN